MSAALVESVREASQAQMRRVAAQKASTSGDLHGMIAYEHQQLYALDLPAILAALTEAESLRAQVAAGQAREVALREAGERLRKSATDGYGYKACADFLEVMDAAPTDTAAIRAIVERAVYAAWSGGVEYEQANGGRSDNASLSDAEVDAIVDRALGGS